MVGDIRAGHGDIKEEAKPKPIIGYVLAKEPNLSVSRSTRQHNFLNDAN